MTTYTFTPSVTSVYSFQPTLDAQVHTCTVTWNIAGQRWYLNCYDAAGNLIFSRAMVGSDVNSALINLCGGYFTTSTMAYYPSSQQIVVTP